MEFKTLLAEHRKRILDYPKGDYLETERALIDLFEQRKTKHADGVAALSKELRALKEYFKKEGYIVCIGCRDEKTVEGYGNCKGCDDFSNWRIPACDIDEHDAATCQIVGCKKCGV